MMYSEEIHSKHYKGKWNLVYGNQGSAKGKNKTKQQTNPKHILVFI